MLSETDVSGLTPSDLLAHLASAEAASGDALARRWIRRALLVGPVATAPSITTRLPFPYQWIPGRLRIALRDRMIARTFARVVGEARFPDVYADNGVDVVASRIARSDPTAWRWPDGRRCALVLTQDVDTGREHQDILALRDLALSLDLRSTVMFVGRTIARYRDLCLELMRDGFEIGLHDVTHDNRIALLSAHGVRERLAPWLAEWQTTFDVRGFRSPSWYASLALWEGLERSGLSYDCSVQDTNVMQQPDRNVGAATYYPYMVGDLVIVSGTVPFDELPWALGVSRPGTTEFWRSKIDHVASTGGVILVNAHPSPWFCGTKSGRAALRECLAYILAAHKPWCATGAELEAHVRSEVERGAMVELGGEPRVRVPRHGAPMSTAGPAGNPIRDRAVHSSSRGESGPC